ncbi:hypothetical protein E2C01_057108 [Portunus trituberculatus]|uniref:Uncharacterized protein n=1 Tax=Portunus trituberculatus TaxID=210409 RepID=A0A5B7H0X7_PORTR|nr:hypothetical protein [Portunus trituberculatus]
MAVHQRPLGQYCTHQIIHGCLSCPAKSHLAPHQPNRPPPHTPHTPGQPSQPIQQKKTVITSASGYLASPWGMEGVSTTDATTSEVCSGQARDPERGTSGIK